MMNGKMLIRYTAKGLSIACIVGIFYNLTCLRGF